MPVICSSCGGQRPYGDFVQIGYKADPKGYYRYIHQRANGIRFSEWRSLEPDMESYINKQAGVYCTHDGCLILDGMLTPEEMEMISDRRLPVQQAFDSDMLVQNLLEVGTRVRSDVHLHQIDANQGAYAEILMPSWSQRKLHSLGSISCMSIKEKPYRTSGKDAMSFSVRKPHRENHWLTMFPSWKNWYLIRMRVRYIWLRSKHWSKISLPI